jgi:hypothetical protein
MPWLALILAAAFGLSDPAEAASDLPKTVRSFLNASYPGWRLSLVNRDAERRYREAAWRGEPNFIWGDFDGDKRTDYGLQIVYPARAGAKEVDVILLDRGTTFVPFVLRTAPPSERRSLAMLRLVKAGESLSDAIDRPIRHAVDGVEVVLWEKGSTSYFFDKRSRRFRSRATLDLR